MTAAAPSESHSARRRASAGCCAIAAAGPASQALEIGPQLGRVLIAELAVGLEAFRDDAFQLRRPLDAQPDARRGPRPCDHFIEDHAEAPDVGTVIDRLAAGLLRRHVGGGSHHDALSRAGNRGHVRLVRGRRPHLGEAEIEHLHVIARADEDVGGLDVAVDDARGMRGVQRVGDLDAHVEHRGQAQRTGGEPILQRRALQILHDDERPPVLLADVVDGADVRVVQRRRRLRFAREPAQCLRIA